MSRRFRTVALFRFFRSGDAHGPSSILDESEGVACYRRILAATAQLLISSAAPVGPSPGPASEMQTTAPSRKTKSLFAVNASRVFVPKSFNHVMCPVRVCADLHGTLCVTFSWRDYQ